MDVPAEGWRTTAIGRPLPRVDSGRPSWVWPTAVLALCHAQAIASFQILNILIDPIRSSLLITDTQYSLLQGVAVAIFAALLGVPAAHWADRRGRRNVILAGMIGWSVATGGCAFAASFGQLFVARVFVGIGEVFLFPAALSLIASVAPRHRLSTAVAAFGCGGPLGAAAALIGGGWIVAHPEWARAILPAAHAGESWRAVFILCGLSGLITATLLVSVREPLTPQPAGGDDKFGNVITQVASSWRTYLPLSFGMVLLATCVFATAAWTPTVLVRVHAMTYAHAGSLTGSAAMIGGFAFAWLAGGVIDRLSASGRRDGVILVSIAFALAFGVLSVVAGSGEANSTTVAAWIAAFALLGTPTVLAGTAFQLVAPERMRSRIMALHLVLMNVVALSCGPTLVAVLTDHAFADPTAVGQSLAVVNVTASVIALGLFVHVRARFQTISLS